MSTFDNANVHGVNRLRRIVAWQFALLIGQFVIGMAVNLIGLPSEQTGLIKTVSSVLLGLHVLTGIGIVVLSVLSLVFAGKDRVGISAMAWRAAGSVYVAFAAGVLNLVTGNDWWSFLMTAGAAGSLLFYGLLYLRS